MRVDEPYSRTTRARRGFTFVELLATVVLIAAILPVAMRGIGLCARLSGQSRRQLEAASLARLKVTELVVSGDYLSGDQQGDFDEDWAGYRWQAAVNAWTEDTVQQLDVTVFWTAQNQERSLTLTTLVPPEGS